MVKSAGGVLMHFFSRTAPAYFKQPSLALVSNSFAAVCGPDHHLTLIVKAFNGLLHIKLGWWIVQPGGDERN